LKRWKVSRQLIASIDRNTLDNRRIRFGGEHHFRPVEDSKGLVYLSAMATTVEQLAKQAMDLPAESRARLADLLVESLDEEALGQIDRRWIEEARRRRDEVRSGRVETIPGEEGLQKVRDALRR
jgi:hypothetical protein